MAETKKKTNSKKSTTVKKSTDNKKSTNVKKETKKVVESKAEKNKTEEVVVEKNETKKNDSFFKKHLVDIILIVAAVVVVIIGIFAASKGDSSSKDEGYLVELNYDQYVDMQNSGEKFAFIVESATCVHCQNFMPVAKKVANENEVYVYYIDLNNLSEEEYTNFTTSNSFFEENEEWGTPTTLVLTGRDVSDSLVGETTEDAFIEFLTNNELMG